MAYYEVDEVKKRLEKVRQIMELFQLDLVLVYYDEFNLANAWYLTAWCPQFESGAVLVTREGQAMILGGPESEPFAKMDSAIKETRNLPVFMVPGEEYPMAKITGFPEVFNELNRCRKIKKAGMVGIDRMPVLVYKQIQEGFTGVEICDITESYISLRYIKSPWEIEQMRYSFKLSDLARKVMIEKVHPGAYEYEVAAAGNEAVLSRGANGFGFTTIVGSGTRSNAVVPTASDKKMEDGETAIIGIAPRWKGYSGTMGDTVPVNGKYSPEQKECMKILQETLYLTKDCLKPGMTGKDIDMPARRLFKARGLFDYIVCPFVHSIGINEAEQPFFGPHGTDELKPGMTVCIDVSFFGHPELNGFRIETGYEITEKGPVPLSEEMDKYFLCVNDTIGLPNEQWHK